MTGETTSHKVTSHQEYPSPAPYDEFVWPKPYMTVLSVNVLIYGICTDKCIEIIACCRGINPRRKADDFDTCNRSQNLVIAHL